MITTLVAGNWCTALDEHLDKPSVYGGCEKIPKNWEFTSGISGILSGVNNNVYVFRGEDYYNMNIKTMKVC